MDAIVVFSKNTHTGRIVQIIVFFFVLAVAGWRSVVRESLITTTQASVWAVVHHRIYFYTDESKAAEVVSATT